MSSPYTPSVFRIKKYGKYFSYFIESLKRSDLESLRDSINYVLFKKLPKYDRLISTEMGSFMLRKNTTDFQFVNLSYEREVKKHLKSLTKDIGLFIDIGACIGEYTIWLANNGVSSIAIEPVNHSAIDENISWNNGAANYITLHSCAVGRDTKKVAFNVIEGVTSSSYINSTGSSATIDCRRLDELIDYKLIDTKKITVIKLDVEGMEIDVLEGAENLLQNVSNLHIIYEHCSCGDENIRIVLNRFGKFYYKDLDGVNTLAIKH